MKDDQKAELFKLGATLLPSGRGIVGRLLKDGHSIEKLLECLRQVQKNKPLEPVSYLKKVVQNYQEKKAVAALDLSRFAEERE